MNTKSLRAAWWEEFYHAQCDADREKRTRARQCGDGISRCRRLMQHPSRGGKPPVLGPQHCGEDSQSRQPLGELPSADAPSPLGPPAPRTAKSGISAPPAHRLPWVPEKGLVSSSSPDKDDSDSLSEPVVKNRDMATALRG